MNVETKEEKVINIDKDATKNVFDDDLWQDAPIVTAPTIKENTQLENTKEENVEDLKKEAQKNDATLQNRGNELKEYLGYDNWEIAKQEIEKLKSSASTKEEIKFSNDQSKKLFEALKEGKEEDVYSFLDAKKKLSNIDKLTPSEALKLHIEQKNKGYSSLDVQDVFEEKYGLPEKPEQYIDETEEEFEKRVKKWDETASKINRRIERNSISAKEELHKLNTEITLPDITKKEEFIAPRTQEELEEEKKMISSFLKEAETSVNNFEGFNVMVKDEEVEIPISYSLSKEEKKIVSEQLRDFAENGFNANIILKNRWVNEDGNTINTKQMIKDLSLLYSEDKMTQKFVNDAAAKRVEQFIKSKNNIHINKNSQQKNFVPDESKTDSQKAMEYFLENA